jgi:FtsP/CotA-like multicopper oxidase with cupredoxin domain
VPDALVEQNPHDPDDAATTRSFHLSGGAINGKPMDIDRIDQAVTVDTTEIWEIDGSGMAHNFHPHDVRFQILDIGGRPPPAHLTGWKDTVPILPGTTVGSSSPSATTPTPPLLTCSTATSSDTKTAE